MKTKIEIKSIYGSVLFSFEKKDNTFRDSVLQAIKIGANLRCADLSRADLSHADLSGANLSGANLSDSDLSGANLSHADLSDSDLRYSDLSRADLSDSNLSDSDLRYSNLSRANLSHADLRRADFNESTAFLLSQCPSEGSFIAWKKARGMIVKLEVCEDAKRSSATTLKCRCSKAKVLDIQELDGSKSDLTEIQSDKDNSFVYKVGEVVSVDDFDDNRFNECSGGIHFFIAREMAVKY